MFQLFDTYVVIILFEYFKSRSEYCACCNVGPLVAAACCSCWAPCIEGSGVAALEGCGKRGGMAWASLACAYNRRGRPDARGGVRPNVLALVLPIYLFDYLHVSWNSQEFECILPITYIWLPITPPPYVHIWLAACLHALSDPLEHPLLVVYCLHPKKKDIMGCVHIKFS